MLHDFPIRRYAILHEQHVAEQSRDTVRTLVVIRLDIRPAMLVEDRNEHAHVVGVTAWDILPFANAAEGAAIESVRHVEVHVLYLQRLGDKV